MNCPALTPAQWRVLIALDNKSDSIGWARTRRRLIELGLISFDEPRYRRVEVGADRKTSESEWRACWALTDAGRQMLRAHLRLYEVAP